MLCIMYSQHLYEMRLLSFVRAYNLGAIFQAERRGKKRDTSKSYTFYSSQWNVTYHPEEHQMQGRVRSIKTCWGASGRNDRGMSRVNEEALPCGAFRLWHLLCSWRLRGDIFQRHPFYAWLSGGLRARRKSYRQKLFAIPHDFRIILFKWANIWQNPGQYS